MSAKKLKRNLGCFFLAVVLGAGYGAYRVDQNLQPMPAKAAKTLRFPAREPLSSILSELETKGIIRSAAATGLYARITKKGGIVEAGTYALKAGMDADQVLAALRKPVTIDVTVPEYFWIARTAEVMERANIAKADDYEAQALRPRDFAKEVDFKLPAGSLEGYLFPDTYKMEPMAGAKVAIRQQLETFEKKVWRPLFVSHPSLANRLQRTMIIASMVEREAKFDAERPLIASVIENRLAKGMPLEIDATVLYAQKRWHMPTRGELRSTISPYNTYLNKGLPPGPICSPGLKSIEAALHPAKTAYLFYVALPNGHSLFAKTLQEHNANVLRRRKAMRRGA